MNSKNSLENKDSKATQKTDKGLIPDIVPNRLTALAFQVLENLLEENKALSIREWLNLWLAAQKKQPLLPC